MAKQGMRDYEVQIIIVKGRGDFPIDMLRYDSCVPFSENDARVIEKTHTGLHGPCRVILRRFSVEKGRGPTERRWRSFGWSVAAVTVSGEA